MKAPDFRGLWTGKASSPPLAPLERVKTDTKASLCTRMTVFFGFSERKNTLFWTKKNTISRGLWTRARSGASTPGPCRGFWLRSTPLKPPKSYKYWVGGGPYRFDLGGSKLFDILALYQLYLSGEYPPCFLTISGRRPEFSGFRDNTLLLLSEPKQGGILPINTVDLWYLANLSAACGRIEVCP